MKNKSLKKLIAMVLIFSTLTGCMGKDKTDSATSTESSQSKSEEQDSEKEDTSYKDKRTPMLSSDLVKKAKEKDNRKYEYDQPITIKRDEKLVVQMNMDIMKSGQDQYTDFVQVYKDPELTQNVGTHFEWVEAEQQIKITPPRWEDASIDSGSAKEFKELDQYDSSDYTLFSKEELKDWGNIGKFYLVKKRDSKTGKKLKKPIVSVVNVEGEISNAPKVKFSVNERGTAELNWDKVEGAETYAVLELTNDKKRGISGFASVIGATTDTKWSATKDRYKTNSEFRNYMISVDEWHDKTFYDLYKKKYKPYEVVADKDLEEQMYAVIAINKDGTSMISNVIDINDIDSALPYMLANYNVADDNGTDKAINFNLAPAFRNVTMCDGNIATKRIVYDVDKAEERDTTYLITNSKGKKKRIKTVKEMCVPYTVEGTEFDGVMRVEKYDINKLAGDLKKLKERQDSLKSNSGNNDVEILIEGKSSGGVNDDQDSKSNPNSEDSVYVDSEIKVHGSNPLTKYLAMNMVAGNETINLSEFPEYTDYLNDAIGEAMYQNPMVLTVKDVKAIGPILKVEYGETKSERVEKQDQIKSEVKKIVKKIIKKGMTDLEKEKAINKYLCTTAEYDYDALKNAKKNNMMFVDKKYDDAFTPYGILVKKIGVCASYAGSFKLLADEAGLDSIVVTGYLDGSLSHAWNKVKIDNEWVAVDSTNNDNDEIKNSLFNLPDKVSKTKLVQDDRFMMDNEIHKYVGKSDKNEMYHLEKKFFDTDKIADKLAKELKKKDKVVLRTKYTLDDAGFNKIAQKVLKKTGNYKLKGYYFYGVIILMK